MIHFLGLPFSNKCEKGQSSVLPHRNSLFFEQLRSYESYGESVKEKPLEHGCVRSGAGRLLFALGQGSCAQASAGPEHSREGA